MDVMRIVGYVRVSTNRQAEHGLGLDVQREALRVWCASHGYRLTNVLADEGVSGAEGLDARTGLGAALDALRIGDADALVVYRLDRLARDLVVQEHLLAEVRRAGAQVFSTSGGETAFLEDHPDDPSRRFVRQILGAVAEYERSLIALRLRAGRRRKAEAGGYACGAPPFGFRAENGELVEDEVEQQTVERIRQLRRGGASLREIAAVLDRQGRAPKRAGRWHASALQRVLARAA